MDQNTLNTQNVCVFYLVKSHLKVCKLGEGSEETTKEFSFKG